MIDFLQHPDFDRSVIICPHDDDGLIGSGGLIGRLSTCGEVSVIMLTDGSLGYVHAHLRGSITDVRKTETEHAYAVVGVKNLFFLEFPDMCLRTYQCWRTPQGEPGAYQKVLRLLRQLRPSLVFTASEVDAHPDHRAANDVAKVAAIQSNAPIVPDLGEPTRIQRLYRYQVYEPLPGPVSSFPLSAQLSALKRQALSAFVSQATVLERLEQQEKISYEREVFSLQLDLSS